MAKGSIAAALCLSLAFQVAAQSPFKGDDAELMNFASAHVGRFATEVKSAPRTLKLSYQVDMSELGFARYDAEQGVLIVDHPRSLDRGLAAVECLSRKEKAKGERSGKVVTITSSACVALWIEDALDGLPLGSIVCSDATLPLDGCPSYKRERKLVMQMTPDQYRSLKAKGFKLAVSFDPAASVKNEVVEMTERTSAATMREPRESQTTSLYVRGIFRSAEIVSLHDQKSLAMFERQASKSSD